MKREIIWAALCGKQYVDVVQNAVNLIEALPKNQQEMALCILLGITIKKPAMVYQVQFAKNITKEVSDVKLGDYDVLTDTTEVLFTTGSCKPAIAKLHREDFDTYGIVCENYYGRYNDIHKPPVFEQDEKCTCQEASQCVNPEG